MEKNSNKRGGGGRLIMRTHILERGWSETSQGSSQKRNIWRSPGKVQGHKAIVERKISSRGSNIIEQKLLQSNMLELMNKLPQPSREQSKFSVKNFKRINDEWQEK